MKPLKIAEYYNQSARFYKSSSNDTKCHLALVIEQLGMPNGTVLASCHYIAAVAVAAVAAGSAAVAAVVATTAVASVADSASPTPNC